MKFGILFVTLTFCLVLGHRPPTANASPLADSSAAWDKLDDPARTVLVQAVTLRGPRDLSKGVVRRCLSEADGSLLATCIVAAARLQMTSTAPILREVIRTSRHATVLGLAARTLGRWSDRNSQDLLLWALVTERGGPSATPFILQGWLKLNPKHESRYLRWLWEQEPASSPRRVEFAIRLNSRTHGNKALAERVRSELLWVWEQWRTSPESVDDDVVLRVAWGLFAEPRGCRVMFQRAGLSMGQGLRDPLLRRLNRSRCRPFVPRDLPPQEDKRLPIPDLPDPSEHFTSTYDTMRWAQSLATIGIQSKFLANALAAEQKRLRAPDTWDNIRAWKALKKPARFNPQGLRDLERTYASLPMPSGMQPDHGLRQPSWWPDSILLTIDDGPRPKMLSAILDVFREQNVKAVFFFVVSQMTKSLFAAPEATRLVLARVQSEGHTIGFHSMNHAIRLGKHIMWRERDQIADSVRLFREMVRRTTGHPWRIDLARLPGAQGRTLSWVNQGLVDGGTGPHLHWESGGHGWSTRTPDSAIRRLARHACRRHVEGLQTHVLLHESPAAARQIEAYVDEVRKRCGVKRRPARRLTRALARSQP